MKVSEDGNIYNCPLCKRKFMWEMGSEWMKFYYVQNWQYLMVSLIRKNN